MMKCPSELTLLMYADAELADEGAAEIRRHADTCSRCRGLLAELEGERQMLAAALAPEAEVVRVPPFQAPASGVAPAAALGMATALVLAVGAGLAAVPAWVGGWLPAPVAWFNPLDGWGVADLALDGLIFLAEQGRGLAASLGEAAATVFVLGLLGWGAWTLRRHPPVHLLLMSLMALAVLPIPAHAIEVRRSDDGAVLVRADETIDDTLIALGETVEIAGEVTGDLIAFGRRVDVRGRVGGVLVTGAETVTVQGEVEDSMVAFARTLEVSPARLGGNLYGFASTVSTDQRVDQNALVFGERVTLTGPVGGDVLSFAEALEVGDVVEGSLEAYAGRVVLLAPARIAGNVTVHVPAEDRLTVSPGAVVGGEITTDIRQHHEQQESRYTSAGYYVAQVLRYGAAFVAGVILLALVPRLRRASLHSPGNALVAGGVGLVAVVATPVIAVIVALTVIGIPVALLGLALWLAGLYFAKVVLAHVIGARVLSSTSRADSFVLALAVGLLIVIVLVDLPFVGGVLNFLLTICGFGLILLFLWDLFRRDPDAGAPPA